MSQQQKADLDTVFERLLARKEQLDRQEDAALRQLGLGSEADLQRARKRFRAVGKLRSALLEKLTAETVDRSAEAEWEEITRPALEDVARQFNGRLIRA